MREKEPVTLQNLYEGAVLEAVDFELANVFANISDPNTSATQLKEATLKIKIKPAKDRGVASLTFQASSKLAPAAELETTLLLDRVGSKHVGYEVYKEDTNQLHLPLDIQEAK